MVSTRNGSSLDTYPVPADENRIIAVVTGANSGYGLGICQQLLSNLSLPPGTPMPASVPQQTAIPPTTKRKIDTAPSVKTVPHSPSPVLTLVLCCRSMKNAQETKETILKIHHKELALRRDKVMKVREGWLAGLRVDCETADLSYPGGENGVLAFCEKMRKRYPHITTLYLNAAIATASHIDFLAFLKQIFTEGFVATVSDPHFVPERGGVMTPDGERGLVWSVNVLSVYIMLRELETLLRRSPADLPVQPRAVLSSSYTAFRSLLRPDPLDDYQLIQYHPENGEFPYKSSKYMADLIAVQFDREFGESTEDGQREVRVLCADPGAIFSNIYTSAFTNWAVVRAVFSFFYYWIFHLANLLGSPKHVLFATNGALAMLYAALADGRYIWPASKVPAPKYSARLNRRRHTRIEYGEVDQWEETLDIGASLMKACETIRQDWRRRDGMD